MVLAHELIVAREDSDVQEALDEEHGIYNLLALTLLGHLYDVVVNHHVLAREGATHDDHAKVDQI